MRQVILTMVVMLVATSARAELFTGAEPLEADQNGPPTGGSFCYGFLFEDGPTSTNVYFNAATLGGPNNHVTGGSLFVNGDGPHQGFFDLISDGPQTFLSPSRCFIADNVFIFGDALVDEFGLLFVNSNGVEANLFVDIRGQQHILFYDPCQPPSPPAVPEPSSMAIGGIALAFVLAGRVLRRRRHA